MDISIIIPLYNESESLRELHDWNVKVMQQHNFSYEFIFVDDGSTDNSWKVVEALSRENEKVKGIKFRRNYGKSAAINVGFEHAEGNVVITMDADLQDSPEEIPELYKMIFEQNFDIVSGWKKKRFDPITKRIPTKLFNFVARKMSGIKLHDFNCGLKAYRKIVVKNIEVYGEMHRYIPIIAKWAGFERIGEKVVSHQSRKYGKTKFGIERFINGFLDMISISFVGKFGKKPMHFFGLLGTLMFFLGFLAITWLGGYKLYCLSHNIKYILLTNNPYFYLALTTMILGTQLFLTGFIAEMIVRNSHDRNKYLIETKIFKSADIPN